MAYNADTSHHHALLMRTIGRELGEKIAPGLSSAAEREKLIYTQLVFDYFAGDLVIAPALLKEMRPLYHAAILAALESPSLTDSAAGLRAELDAIVQEDGLAAQREVTSLRNLASNVVRALSDSPNSDAGDAARIARIGKLDTDWLIRYHDAMRGKDPVAEEDAAPVSGDKVITPAIMTKYLRQHMPALPDIEAVTVTVVPGGRSKRTIAITLANAGDLPTEIIMRQDMILKYAGPTIRDEVAPLQKLADIGIAVPAPLHFQPEETELGGPFFLTKLQRGGPPADYFGVGSISRQTLEGVARGLGKLHSLDPAAVGIVAGDISPRELVANLIERYWGIWRQNSTRGSALIDAAYAWARRTIAKPYVGTPTLVHGDIGPYNWLVENGELTVILDWEFLHSGDPAEDLGTVRPYTRGVIPWDEFMQIYHEAGGADVSDERVALGEMLQWLKGTILTSTSARNFIEGGTTDFMKGANSFAGMRRIEMKIAGVLAEQLAD